MRFVIVAARRTGSNLLCSLLDSHPAILCHHELFNPKGIFQALSRREGGFDLGTILERDRDPGAFFDRVWREARGYPCVGFKMTCGQAEETLQRVLADRSLRKIVLHRRNRVKTWVSERLAERLDQWEVYDPGELTPARPRVEIDVRDLLEHVASNEAFYREVEASLAKTRQPFLSVHYEDLWDPALHQEILCYLDVESAGIRLEPGSVKQNPRDLRQTLSNFDEVSEALRGDPLRDELLDREN